MSPLHVAVIVYFDVLHLVTERNNHRMWSMFLKILPNPQENTCVGVCTYPFNSQSMGRPDKCRSSQWRCSVKNGVLKNLANLIRTHLCLSFFLIKLLQISSATLLKLDTNTDIFL